MFTGRLPARIVAALIVAFIILVPLVNWLLSTPTSDLPPLYEDYVELERNLTPAADQSDVKYVYFANHVYGEGYGNVLQEMVMHAHLAFLSKRSFVFYNYTWDRRPDEYSAFNGKIIPSRLPMSASLSGPIVGSASSLQPQAVSVDYYRSVCADPTVITVEEGRIWGGKKTMDYWTQRLGESKDKCIEFHKDSKPVFDYFFFGTEEALEVWGSLYQSPILREWSWSPLVRSAYQRNIDLFQAPSDLAVLHLRRGDFEGHCYFLAKTSSRFSGFNSFPSIPDTFAPPPKPTAYDLPMMNNVQNAQVYLDRCYPSIQIIVGKLQEIQDENNGQLKSLYIMTNGKPQWLSQLKTEIGKAMPGKFKTIATSRDLELSREEKGVSQVLDMLVAADAKVFVGNGFSSLTANVVMLRMAKGLKGTRLW